MLKLRTCTFFCRASMSGPSRGTSSTIGSTPPSPSFSSMTDAMRRFPGRITHATLQLLQTDDKTFLGIRATVNLNGTEIHIRCRWSDLEQSVAWQLLTSPLVPQSVRWIERRRRWAGEKQDAPNAPQYWAFEDVQRVFKDWDGIGRVKQTLSATNFVIVQAVLNNRNFDMPYPLSSFHGAKRVQDLPNQVQFHTGTRKWKAVR